MFRIEKGKGNKILKSQSGDIKQSETKTSEYQKILKFMKEQINLKKDTDITLGIAAPQIGINKNLIIIRDIIKFSGDGQILEEKIYELINPKIIKKSYEVNIGVEGCLSVPGVLKEIKRANSIEVEYLNKQFKKIRKIYNGLNARVVQHEIDHLNGILITDK